MALPQKVMNMAYGLGAAVVIIGALFKLMHWPWASEMQILAGILIIIGVMLIFISLLRRK